MLELTVRHATRPEYPSIPEMLACIEQLAPRGTVVVTDFPETYLLSRYLRRHSVEPLRFILTVATVVKTLDESFYRDLPGNLLEGIGRLLSVRRQSVRRADVVRSVPLGARRPAGRG